MKKWFFFGAITALIFSSCTKDDTTSTACTATTPTTVAPDSQKVYLQTYLAANNITNAVEKNGMFYVINTQGSGASPSICSYITTSFTGKFIKGTADGVEFDFADSWEPYSKTLNNLIDGWKIILPLLKTGGTVTMYIPPFLAYGATDNNTGRIPIPANSYLKFQVSLLGFQ
jgi:FKBP-type peptidyl-prolyl cis-trans isomerase FkpA